MPKFKRESSQFNVKPSVLLGRLILISVPILGVGVTAIIAATPQIFHTIIIPDFLSFVKDAATPSIIGRCPIRFPICRSTQKRKKTALFAILGYFAVIWAF